MALEKALILTIRDKLKHDKLHLPTLPEVAMQVCESVDDPNCSLHDVADVIARDPSLTARVIRVANSALYSRNNRASGILDAVTRIGLSQIKNVARTVAMEQIYVSDNEAIYHRMEKNWRASVTIACAALALHGLYKQNNHSGLDSNELLLMGVVCKIGALPVLLEIERLPKVLQHQEVIDSVLENLSGEIGAALMRDWNFGGEYEAVVSGFLEPEYAPESPHYVDFLRMGALYAGEYSVDEETRQFLMQEYVDKGLVASVDIFSDPDFIALYRDASASFM